MSLDRVIALNSKHRRSVEQPGGALMALNRAEEALAGFERAVTLKANYGDAWKNRAMLLTALGRPEDAVECLSKLIALEPDNVSALGSLFQPPY